MTNQKNDSLQKKLQQIWDYEKPAIFLISLIVFILCNTIAHFAASTKPICYMGFVNVAISNDTEQSFADNFIHYLKIDSHKNKVETYQNLYITENPEDAEFEYAYASQIKIMAAIDAEKLDLIIMDKKALEIFSQNGYLQDMDSFLKAYDSMAAEKLSPYIVNSTGLDLSFSPIAAKAGFSEPVYLGIIANSSRNEMVGEYLDYLSKPILSHISQ